MADFDENMAAVRYYARERYHRHLQTAVLKIQPTHDSDPALHFWRVYGAVMEGRLAEGMRELEAILDKRDTILCAPLLLLYTHKKCQTVDREAVQQLEVKVRAERTSCGEGALGLAATVLWLTGRHDKAREYVDRMLKIAPGSREGLMLRGWVDLTCGREVHVKKSIKYFDEALSDAGQPKPVDALLGRAQYYQRRGKLSLCLEALNEAIAGHPGFLPALVEKMRAQLVMVEWDQAVETARRCLGLSADCIPATQMLALERLARAGDTEGAAAHVAELLQLLDRSEPKNHALYFETSQALSRLSGASEQVLQLTCTLAERALQLAPLNAHYHTELGHQLLQRDRLREARSAYSKAFSADETSIAALAGTIHCQLLEGSLAEAEQQLEFLEEVQLSGGKQARLVYLSAQLAAKKAGSATEVLPLLQEAMELHFAAIKGQPLSLQYYGLLDAPFLQALVEGMLTFAPTEPCSSPSQVPAVLRRAGASLEASLRLAPGLTSMLLQLARVKFLSGECEAAQTLLQRCLEREPDLLSVHIMMARLALHQGNTTQSFSSLELALSKNFEVQGSPLYHLVKGQTERLAGRLQDALASLQTAMDIITARKPASAVPSRLPALSQSERLTVYLGLASVHADLDQQPDSAKVMSAAITEFSGSPEEARLTVASADLAVSRGDVEEALALLRGVDDNQPHFIQAREKMAEIYYKHKKDYRRYIGCYKELAEKLPGPPTALLLGDAYMDIQEHEEAMRVFEAALKRTPRDGILASKVGQCLIKMHSYARAISYYEAALRGEGGATGTHHQLRLDLATLHLRLKHFERAEKTLAPALKQKEDLTELQSLQEATECLVLLARVQHRAGQPPKAMATLNEAREMQSRVLKRVGLECPEAVLTQEKLAANIACQIAEHSAAENDHDNAIRFYREALLHCPDQASAHLALAELHLQRGELDLCEQQCTALLRTQPENEEATVMMADLLFRRGDYGRAASHFIELLGRLPGHFVALSRLIDLKRRAGELEACQPYIDQAEKSCARSAYEPGVAFCRGLYKRYQNNPTEALHFFNQARKDGEWGEKAIFCMIEICLNPDNDTMGGETFKPLEGEVSSSEDQMAVRTAEKLLKEVRPRTPASEQRRQVLECSALLATRSKASAEKGLTRLMEMAASERDSVATLLGMARAHLILRQVPRARNHLKRISRMQWNSREAEEFEQSWLLLADIFIQGGKSDLAMDLLSKCTAHNQSCSRAWEYMGFIQEKDQAFKDAAAHYEKAWKFSSCSDPGVGYKLAFNYLKAHRYVDAIDVCHQVLGRHPRYPRIRKDILDKARVALKT